MRAGEVGLARRRAPRGRTRGPGGGPPARGGAHLRFPPRVLARREPVSALVGSAWPRGASAESVAASLPTIHLNPSRANATRLPANVTERLGWARDPIPAAGWRARTDRR